MRRKQDDFVMGADGTLARSAFMPLKSSALWLES
jgi:hypothetical protein